MLKADPSLLKKITCFLLILLIAVVPSVNGKAESEDDLYFGALEEKIASNVMKIV